MLEKHEKQIIVNKKAQQLGIEITPYDRRLLANKYAVDISYINYLLSGKRKAIRGKSVEILKMAEILIEINKQKLHL